MDLHTGAGARTAVRMRQRQELRRRNLAVGAAVLTPTVILGVWVAAAGGLFTDRDPPAQARINSLAEYDPPVGAAPLPQGERLEQATPTTSAEGAAADAAQTNAAQANTDPGAAVRVAGPAGERVATDLTTQLAPSSPSLGEPAGPSSARPLPSSAPSSTGSSSTGSSSGGTSAPPASSAPPSSSSSSPSGSSLSGSSPHTHPWDPTSSPSAPSPSAPSPSASSPSASSPGTSSSDDASSPASSASSSAD